jgi:hypothetical protein
MGAIINRFLGNNKMKRCSLFLSKILVYSITVERMGAEI